MQNILKYQREIFKLLDRISSNQKHKFLKVAKEFYKTYKNNGMIYIFGTLKPSSLKISLLYIKP